MTERLVVSGQRWEPAALNAWSGVTKWLGGCCGVNLIPKQNAKAESSTFVPQRSGVASRLGSPRFGWHGRRTLCIHKSWTVIGAMWSHAVVQMIQRSNTTSSPIASICWHCEKCWSYCSVGIALASTWVYSWKSLRERLKALIFRLLDAVGEQKGACCSAGWGARTAAGHHRQDLGSCIESPWLVFGPQKPRSSGRRHHSNSWSKCNGRDM